jgi:hypothetical protein
LFVYGTPGTGKTSLVLDRFAQRGSVIGEDFLLVKGVTRPMGLYTLLCDNKSSSLIFDDCDTAWGDQDSANILKAALEMSGKRMVSYYSKSVKDAGYPTSFEFSGSIIFISNLSEEDVDTAIRSRSYCAGIFATQEEMLVFMEVMLEKVEPDVPMTDKREVLEYLKSVKDQLRSFDLRTLVKTIRLKVYKKNWKDLAVQFV